MLPLVVVPPYRLWLVFWYETCSNIDVSITNPRALLTHQMYTIKKLTYNGYFTTLKCFFFNLTLIDRLAPPHY